MTINKLITIVIVVIVLVIVVIAASVFFSGTAFSWAKFFPDFNYKGELKTDTGIVRYRPYEWEPRTAVDSGKEIRENEGAYVEFYDGEKWRQFGKNGAQLGDKKLTYDVLLKDFREYYNSIENPKVTEDFIIFPDTLQKVTLSSIYRAGTSVAFLHWPASVSGFSSNLTNENEQFDFVITYRGNFYLNSRFVTVDNDPSYKRAFFIADEWRKTREKELLKKPILIHYEGVESNAEGELVSSKKQGYFCIRKIDYELVVYLNNDVGEKGVCPSYS